MKVLLFTIAFVTFSFFTNSELNAQTGSGQKVVIIDSGIYSNALFRSTRVIDKLCWSKNDQATSDSQ